MMDFVNWDDNRNPLYFWENKIHGNHSPPTSQSSFFGQCKSSTPMGHSWPAMPYLKNLRSKRHPQRRDAADGVPPIVVLSRNSMGKNFLSLVRQTSKSSYVGDMYHTLVSLLHIIAGWWARATPLKNMTSSIGMIIPYYSQYMGK